LPVSELNASSVRIREDRGAIPAKTGLMVTLLVPECGRMSQ
jgi:hypothetical protein